MPVSKTDMDGLLVVTWDTHEDDRGFFRQTYQLGELEQTLGRDVSFVQGNHSRSEANVLRGFHAEPWDKLVYAVRGTVAAVIADIRPESSTFGETQTFILGDAPGERIRLFISEGLANSFYVVSDAGADYVYEVGAYWRPDVEKRAVAWDDPDLAVRWPVPNPIVSPADASNPTLRELFPDHPRWQG